MAQRESERPAKVDARKEAALTAIPEASHGRIDTHTHLLPSVDDGCTSVADSMRLARMLIDAGYTHAFCTPHIWPSLPVNNIATIPAPVIQLQSHLDENRIPLRLLCGGELTSTRYGLKSADGHASRSSPSRWPANTCSSTSGPSAWTTAAMRCTRARASEVDGTHADPRRSRAIMALQDDPDEINALRDAGVLLQMNLWCLTEPRDSPIYRTATTLLKDGKYFMFGTDCHNPESLPRSIEGLAIATELVGEENVRKMTIDHPRNLIPVAR